MRPSQDNHPPETRRALTLKSALVLLLVIGGTVAFGVVFLAYVAPDTGDTEMSGHGMLAMVLGIGFSLVVGVGLMALVFLSSRRGYDQNIARRDEQAHRP